MPPFFWGGEHPPKKFSLKEQLRLLKSFISFYPRHKKLLALDLTFVILGPSLSTVTPLIIYRVLNVYLPAKDMKMLLLCLCGVFGLALFSILSNYVRMRYGDTLGIRIETDMRNDLFAHIQKLSFGYFDRTKTGHIMSRITNDLSMIGGFAHHCPEDIISAVIMLVGGLIVMININPWLTLLSMVPIPLMLVWMLKILPLMKEKFRAIRKRIADVSSNVENAIQGIREVKSYTNEEPELEKFKETNHTYRQVNEDVFSIHAMFHSGMMFFMHGYSVMFIAIGALMMYYGYASAAELITFFMYSHQITMPVMRLVGFIQMYQQGMTAFERFQEIMDEEPEIQDKPDALQELPSPIKGKIQFANVSFHYDVIKNSGDNPLEPPTEKQIPTPGPQVLDHVSFDIEAGKTVAVVGESGAGKTTLAALIPRFYDAQDGEISIDGIPVSGFSQKLLRQNIGIVQQTPFLFDTTIRKNILFGRQDATEEELVAAAKAAHIYDFIQTLPDGFDSLCGENGVRLSGGQKQRISIARVFLKNPPILIFDEATSALDNESEALVQQAMEELCKGRTTIIIAHRLSTTKNADFIICMQNGKIIEQGNHAELLAKNGYFKELYTIHSF